MNFKTQEIKRIIIKSPLIPLFQRGKLLSPPFGLRPRAVSDPEGKGGAGGIFKTLKCYQKHKITAEEALLELDSMYKQMIADKYRKLL